MEQLRQMRADPCFAPRCVGDHMGQPQPPAVLALVRKRGRKLLVGLFNFTEYPAGASLVLWAADYKIRRWQDRSVDLWG